MKFADIHLMPRGYWWKCLTFNAGGVVHSREEIERVKALLAKEPN